MPSLSSTFKEKLHLGRRSRDYGREASGSTPNLLQGSSGEQQPTTGPNASEHSSSLPPTPPKDFVPPRRTSLDQPHNDIPSASKSSSHPPVRFDLPTIPQTPAGEEDVLAQKQLGGGGGGGDALALETHSNGPKTPPKWSLGEVYDVYATKQDLAAPKALTSAAQITSQSSGAVNPAFVASRSYSYNPFPPPADLSEHQLHIAKHLPLLEPLIFQPTHRLARTQPGKVKPLEATPPVSTLERDRVLDQQRERLAGKIAWSETVARQAGLRAPPPDERTLEIFDRAGWSDRVGVRDTLDVHTRVLPPVIQEHVQPVETVIYQLMIFREVHKYHIYPYIQPIRDPSPTVLPTRHLFRDRDGNLREVYGDEAAERVLGRKLNPATDGVTYVERWIEGVDGIEYQTELRKIEDESVLVGRRAYVEQVGQRGGGVFDKQLAETEGGRYMVDHPTPTEEVGRAL